MRQREFVGAARSGGSANRGLRSLPVKTGAEFLRSLSPQSSMENHRKATSGAAGIRGSPKEKVPCARPT
jgi:hypothetical protein